MHLTVKLVQIISSAMMSQYPENLISSLCDILSDLRVPKQIDYVVSFGRSVTQIPKYILSSTNTNIQFFFS